MLIPSFAQQQPQLQQQQQQQRRQRRRQQAQRAQHAQRAQRARGHTALRPTARGTCCIAHTNSRQCSRRLSQNTYDDIHDRVDDANKRIHSAESSLRVEPPTMGQAVTHVQKVFRGHKARNATRANAAKTATSSTVN